MEHDDLKVISITALVLAVISFMTLVIRWIVKRWFVGSWADKIIGGVRKQFTLKESDIAEFGARCKALQKDIIDGTRIDPSTMGPILNTIYVAFYCGKYYKYYLPRKPSKTTLKELCDKVTNGLTEAPLAAFILIACPYMFMPDIRKLLDYNAYCEMLKETPKNVASELGIKIDDDTERQKALMERYFDPISKAITEKVSSELTKDFIYNWSKNRVTLNTVDYAFMTCMAGNTIGFTAEKAADALIGIVIADVYEALARKGAYIRLDQTAPLLEKLDPNISRRWVEAGKNATNITPE